MSMNTEKRPKNTYKAIEELYDEALKQAYHELKFGLPSGNNSIVRLLQNTLYRENGRVIELSSVQYRIAMEMLNRFYENKC